MNILSPGSSGSEFVEESFLDVVKGKLVIEQVVWIFLVFEQIVEVLLLHTVVLLHHTSATGQEFHLFNSLLVLEQETDDAVETVDKEECPTHRWHVGWVKGDDL